jgi:SAM-dependent methyltransferase
MVDRWFDLWYGTDTCGWTDLDNLHIIGENKSRGFRYEPARIVLVRRMFRQARSVISPSGGVVDLGSGKGRVMLIASEFGFARATGVEFAPELCAVAQRNCDLYRRKTRTTTAFRVVESDVANYAIAADDNLFFLFNPFDGVVLGKVLQNLGASLRKHPRRILLCFYNSEFTDLVSRQTDFVKISDVSYWGYRFVIFVNSN